MPKIPELGSLKQEDLKFKASMGSVVRLLPPKKKKSSVGGRGGRGTKALFLV